MDLEALNAVHRSRIAAIDPLVPAPHTSTVGDGQTLLDVGGAVGLADEFRPDPDTLDACWGALAQHRLVRSRVDGPDSMDALLTAWQAHVAAQPDTGDRETSAGLMWPSRDTEMHAVFLRHGLVPYVAVAARHTGRGSTDAALDGVAVRPIGVRDADAAAALQMDEIAWDARFGAAFVRDSTPARVREEIGRLIAADRPSAWVAEVDGDVAGFLSVEWPGDAGWVAGLAATDEARLAYIPCMSVRPGRRGAGIGAALAGHVHVTLDAAGIETVLLHYATMNPLSAPFWHRSGYRPLWTSWDARPHTRLR
jgi:GNAT superfamily N-acetyltransferase